MRPSSSPPRPRPVAHFSLGGVVVGRPHRPSHSPPPTLRALRRPSPPFPCLLILPLLAGGGGEGGNKRRRRKEGRKETSWEERDRKWERRRGSAQRVDRIREGREGPPIQNQNTTQVLKVSFPLSSHLTPISAANGRLRRLRHSPRDGSTKGASSHKSTVTTPPNGTEPATRRPKP